MYVEITKPYKNPSNPIRFAFQDLTQAELELFQEALIDYKKNRLQDADAFREDRRSCVEMFQKIDAELIKSKQNANTFNDQNRE